MNTDQPSQNVTSSPSAGSHTGYGTPSTVPTMMSPDTGGVPKTVSTAIPALQLNTTPDGAAAPHLQPASTNSSISVRRNGSSLAPVIVTGPPLSPTAEEFTPSANVAGNFGLYDGGHRDGSGNGIYNAVGQAPARSRNNHPAASGRFLHASQVHVLHGTFSINEPTSRAFVVTGCDIYCTDFQYVATSFKNFASLQNIDASLLHQGTFSVEFTDFNDAKQAALLALQFLFRDQPIKVFKLTHKDLAAKQGMPEESVSNWEATFTVGVLNLVEGAHTLSVHELLETCKLVGAVKAFARVGERSFRRQIVAVFRVEWYDTNAAVEQLNGRPFGNGFRLIVEPFKPDVSPCYKKASIYGPAPPSRPVPALNDAEHTDRVIAFLQHPRSTQSNATGNNNNVVNIDRIMRGLDVRTTIMLRNIPNRVNQDGLKMLLDQTSRGEYDFMYLRIDFANNCNVGYAFINFAEPVFIIPFAQARAGQKWNLFNSDKVAEISYATIQGRDCLIQKFRNSSVMLERGSFRPKLYKTGSGPDAGTEEPFPGPDNQAKLKRSCDNAEHVGLYIPPTRTSPYNTGMMPPPRNQTAGGSYVAPATTRRASVATQDILDPALAQNDLFTFPGISPKVPTSLYAPREGQAYRERQRRQQSQFDRGTPGAQVQSTQKLSSSQSSGYLTRVTSPSLGTVTSPVSPMSLANGTAKFHDFGNQDDVVHKHGLSTLAADLEKLSAAESPSYFLRRLLGGH